MTTPAVSVIISVYNSEHYLLECGKDLRAQTFKDFEAILVDPGSRDHSAAICQQLAREDPRFRYLRVEGSSLVSYCRAKAVQAARAPLVAMLDSDDRAFPKRLEIQANWMTAHTEAVLCGTYYRVISERGWVLRISPNPIQADIEIRWRLLFGNCLTHSTIMFRKDAALRAGNYDPSVRAGEDLEFYSRLLTQGSFAVIPKVLGAWRVHKHSLSKTEAPAFKADFVKTVQNSIRLQLGEDVTLPLAAALYSQSDAPADNAQTFRDAVSLIQRAEDRFRRRLGPAPHEHRLLSRAVFLKLVQIMTTNRRQTWWKSAELQWIEMTRNLTVDKNGYRWYLDPGLGVYYKALLASDLRFLFQRRLY